MGNRLVVMRGFRVSFLEMLPLLKLYRSFRERALYRWIENLITANGNRFRVAEESSRDCEFNLRFSTAVCWGSQTFRGITSGSYLAACNGYADCQFYDVNALESVAFTSAGVIGNINGPDRCRPRGTNSVCVWKVSLVGTSRDHTPVRTTCWPLGRKGTSL